MSVKEMEQTVLEQEIDQAIASGREFGLAIFPGESTPVWFNGVETGSTMEIVPWLNTYARRITIGGNKPEGHAITMPIPEHSTTHDEYLQGVRPIIENCRHRRGKTVYSRVICGELEHSRISHVATELFAAHPHTLRFIYHTPQTRLWLGATPELLLDFNKATGQFRTMAFAGTRRSGSGTPWDAKNIHENRFVIEYIADALAGLGIAAHISPLETVAYGNIEHLCAHISGNAVPCQLHDILDAINPTPALCGWPKPDAIADISRYELHGRGCYGGFIGFSTPQRYIAFVNLRSMQFHNGKFCIYGGGGITAESEPEAEYSETDAKTKFLRTLLEQAQSTSCARHSDRDEPGSMPLSSL